MTMHLRSNLAEQPLEAALPSSIAFKRASSLYRDYVKRAIDIAVVLLLAAPTALILIVFALIIMRDGRSPFYRQERVGRDGRPFSMWKLRSMVPDAEHMLEKHLADNPAAMEEWNRTQKLRKDPRITAIGRIIRPTSIDELPQLWNVFVGDMSLVGPRPMMPNQTMIYPGSAYFAIRPGITGYWQTSARNDASFAQRADFDTRYLRDLSFWTDIKVLLRTVRVVIRGTGY